ncbi:thioredoxin domain-containing protein [Candidatus Woesearchaeota archaeon]|nr:thioredoxin domain-containing protein [Candidatus Woesearchaeota archaeon]
MAKKETPEVKKEKKLMTRNNLVFAVIVGLVIGFFVGYGASFYKGSASSDTVAENVLSYVDSAFLAPGGASSSLTSVETNYGMYEVKFDILQDGEVVQQDAVAYASKDGKYLIVGQVFPLEDVQEEETETPQQQMPAEMPKTDKPNVKFFVMTFCPYGQQAEAGLGPALAELGSKVVAEPHFVIYENYGGGGPDYCLGDGKYCSMHGIKELNEGVRQLCIYKYKQDKWWDYVEIVNSKCSLSNIDTCWKDAAKEVGFDVDKIEDCQEEEALELLEAEVKLNEQFGVRGSPSIFINDYEYSGGRSPGNYLSAICSAFNTAPEECDAELATATAAPTGGCG